MPPHVFDICNRVIAMVSCHSSTPLQKGSLCHVRVCGCGCVVAFDVVTVIIFAIVIRIVVCTTLAEQLIPSSSLQRSRKLQLSGQEARHVVLLR